MPDSRDWMTAEQAAAHLGVTRQTLYAYVSRGHLRGHVQAGRRERRYRRLEVERLALRHASARQPRRVAVQTLDWGLPVLTSQLTLIDGGQLSYRGHDAVAWAATATLEDTAALLWGCDRDAAFVAPPPLPDASTRAALRRLAATAQGPARLTAAWPLLAQVAAPELPRHAVAAHWLQAMALAVTLQVPSHHRTGQGPRPLHQQLRQAWRLPPAADDALRQALVLCADHELNASSFTARCVAATGAGLAAAVTAGLAALSGPRHGAMTMRVEAMWPAVEAASRTPARLRRWIDAEATRQQAQRLARGLPRIAGDTLPGFGHPLYPDGDPRARALLALLPADAARERFVAMVQERIGQAPALDFALVALRRSLGAPEGAAFSLFALARTAGWIAHALEQQDSGALIRPRAAYVGPRPDRAAPPPPAGRVIRRR
ncbi:MAG: hypothetical protein RJA10_533 [Pseudomonadota bacterium]|jgi:citrate synthase